MKRFDEQPNILQFPPDARKDLRRFQKSFVCTLTDKASTNFSSLARSTTWRLSSLVLIFDDVREVVLLAGEGDVCRRLIGECAYKTLLV